MTASWSNLNLPRCQGLLACGRLRAIGNRSHLLAQAPCCSRQHMIFRLHGPDSFFMRKDNRQIFKKSRFPGACCSPSSNASLKTGQRLVMDKVVKSEEPGRHRTED